MGRKSDYPGVEEHHGHLRIVFSYKGERCRESLKQPATPANFGRAAKLRAEILRKINLGTFDYAEHFPDSARAAASTHTFLQVAQEWLELQTELAKSTVETYEQILNTHWIPKLGDKAIAAITPGQAKRTVLDRSFTSIKTRNNSVSVLRMVFTYALGERYIKESPAAKLEHMETESKEPDPFTFDERAKILEHLKTKAHPQTYHYFLLAFASGMRTSEIIQLQWSKVDLNSGLIRVDEARVRGQVKTTKTRRSRDVEITAETRAALVGQERFTLLAGVDVFLNPNTGNTYYNQQAPGLALKACLKALRIRHRPAYNTRHTFATLNLMSGANPYWVSKQLGHSSLEMTLKTYATWIANSDSGRERDRVEKYLADLAGGNRGGKLGVKRGNGE